MMKKQTAVEWLDNRLKDESVLIQNSEGYHICIRVETLGELINQAKEMEREQIEEAHGNKQKTKSNPDSIVTYGYTYTGEMYYNETYSK
jgi:hypothetical protein